MEDLVRDMTLRPFGCRMYHPRLHNLLLRFALILCNASDSQAVEDAEKGAIMTALAECDNHRERTDELLDISVRSLHYKMNLYVTKRHTTRLGL